MIRAAAVLPIAFLMLFSGSAARSHDDPLIRIYAKQRAIASIDLGRDGPSAGDRSFQGLTLEDKIGHAIGYAAVTCISMGHTLPGTVYMCQAVYVLPRGKLTASGTRQRRDFYTFAITGGTGIYQAYSGTVLGTLASTHPRRDHLVFSLI